MKDKCEDMPEKFKHIFETEHLKSNLKSRSISSGMSTMFGEGVSSVLRIVSTIILARILVPEHFGLIGMVLALTGFAAIFKDLGLSDATIQRKNITHTEISVLFWINVAIGILLMVVVAAASAAIAWFYEDERLIGITLVLSISFFFTSLMVQHQALLRRQMHFFHLALVQILATGITVTIGIGMAVKGFGYWALVWNNVALSVFMTIGMWVACQWRPSLPRRSPGVKSLLSFGVDITGFNIVNYFSRNLDNILIGKVWGAGPLGFYSVAYRLMMLPINQIRVPLNAVGLSALSTLQSDTEKYRNYYEEFLSILSFISMPLIMYMAVFSDELILLVLGAKWQSASSIFRILAIAAFIQPSASTRGFVMISTGLTRRYLKWGIANALFVTAGFVVGIRWGVIGVATSYAAANYLILIPSLFYCFKDTPVDVSNFFKAIIPPVICSVMMGLTLIVLKQQLVQQGLISFIAITVIVALLTYILFSVIYPGGRMRMVKYFSHVLTALKSSKEY